MNWVLVRGSSAIPHWARWRDLYPTPVKYTVVILSKPHNQYVTGVRKLLSSSKVWPEVLVVCPVNTLNCFEGKCKQLLENTIAFRICFFGSVVLCNLFITLISFSLSEYYHLNLLGVGFQLTRFQSLISCPI